MRIPNIHQGFSRERRCPLVSAPDPVRTLDHIAPLVLHVKRTPCSKSKEGSTPTGVTKAASGFANPSHPNGPRSSLRQSKRNSPTQNPRREGYDCPAPTRHIPRRPGVEESRRGQGHHRRGWWARAQPTRRVPRQGNRRRPRAQSLSALHESWSGRRNKSRPPLAVGESRRAQTRPAHQAISRHASAQHHRRPRRD